MTDKCGITEYCEMRIGDECTLGSPCPHQEPLTNEEWFYSLSTEEKAKTIICLAVNSMHKKRKGLIENDVNEIMRWLKEKHNDSVQG